MNNSMKWYKQVRIWKGVAMMAASLTCFVVGVAYADSGTAPQGSIGALAGNVIDSLSSLAKLITAGAYVAGMGFAIGAILKFKAHKDNPQQIPVGTPIALIFIAAALIFMPAVLGTTGMTLFGSGNAKVGGVSGTTLVPDSSQD